MAAGDILSLPALEAGLVRATGAVAWTPTDWQVVGTPSATVPVYIFGFCGEPPAAATVDLTWECMVEIGLGATGSEVLKIQYPMAVRSDALTSHLQTNMWFFWLPEPFEVPANTQVSWRFAWEHTAAGTFNGFKIFYREGEAGPTDFPLDAEPGAYAVTGTEASPVATRLVDASPTSYALTGLAAGIPAGRAVTAVPGSYTLTGSAAGVLATRILDAATGAYTLTGFGAGMFAARTIVAGPGVFALIGVDAELLYGALGPGAFQLDAQPAVFALTGEAAGVLATRLFSADPGAYVLTGQAAGLLTTRTLTATPGSYAHTGIAAGLALERTLLALPASYTLTGAPATFLATRALAATPGVYVITGADALLATVPSLVPADLELTQAPFAIVAIVASLTDQQLIVDNDVPIVTITEGGSGVDVTDT